MKTEQIVMCVVALLLGMLLFHMLKGVCGCKVVEGQCSGEWGSRDNPVTADCLRCLNAFPLEDWPNHWTECGGESVSQQLLSNTPT